MHHLDSASIHMHGSPRARIIGFVRSVRFRLTIWFGVILGLVLLAFSVFIYSRQASTMEEQLVNQLQKQGLAAVKFYSFLADQSQLAGSNQTLSLPSNEILLLTDNQGRVIRDQGLSDANFASALASDLARRAEPLPVEEVGTIRADIAGQVYAFSYLSYASNPLEKGDQANNGNAMLLFVGLPLDGDGQLKRLAMTLLLAGPSTLLLALAGGYWLAGRAMHPVQSITRMAQEISETDLSRRLNLDGYDEIGELARTFDQMLDRLQTAFERQRQFTADASHELRTPLTIVSLEVNRALARHYTPREFERALSVIGAENDYMGHVVNDLLILARADAGQSLLKREELNWDDLTLDVVERLRPLARRHGLELITDDLPELRIYGDSVYLTQMLTNLLENAIKYSAGVGHHVWVEGERQWKVSQEWGCIRVKDDGPGIAAEHLSHLFDRFYRVDEARSQPQSEAEMNDGVPGGSGLGLAIVQWVVHAHGGTVSVHSELGSGTTFEVQLPLATSLEGIS